MSPPSPYQESNRRVNNPLIDLIETEKKYLKDLKCLLQVSKLAYKLSFKTFPNIF
jgi:hypothetical protein